MVGDTTGACRRRSCLKVHNQSGWLGRSVINTRASSNHLANIRLTFLELRQDLRLAPHLTRVGEGEPVTET